MSLEQVSALLDELGHPMAPTVLSRTERGRRELRAVEAAALSRVYGIEPAKLLDVLTVDWEAAHYEKSMRVAWVEVAREISRFVAAQRRLWAADPDALRRTTRRTWAPPPTQVIPDKDEYEVIHGVLETLGIGGLAASLVWEAEDADHDG